MFDANTLNTVSQIAATVATIAVFAGGVVWNKHDEKERHKHEREARRRAWAREIEAAGRRMMERDERERIMHEPIRRGQTVVVKGAFADMAEAWE